MPTELDIFQATVHHEPHDGFLFHASFTPDLERRVRKDFGIGESDIRDFFGMYNPAMPEPIPPEKYAPPDFSRYFESRDITENAFINHLGVLEVPGSMFHFTGYVSPLRDARRFEDLELFPWPNIDGYAVSHMTGEVRAAHERGKVAGCWIGHMYEDSWQIRGYEQFLMDMIDRPEWCEYVLDRLQARNLSIVRAAASAGVDWIKTGDDVANQRAMMFSVGMWRRFMKPRWAEVFSLARSIKPDIEIWYHSDGNIEPIIPELIEIGVTILNPVQPECLDLSSLKAEYGDRLVFDGAIGTQTTMPFGTPDEVRKTVRERIRTLGSDGALILSPTHVLEPEVPLNNLRAFVEAAKEA
ncbi:MAG: uroporphyrinogen decarboxylase family protein [Candidatus Latescibacterota bacterium]